MISDGKLRHIVIEIGSDELMGQLQGGGEWWLGFLEVAKDGVVMRLKSAGLASYIEPPKIFNWHPLLFTLSSIQYFKLQNFLSRPSFKFLNNLSYIIKALLSRIQIISSAHIVLSYPQLLISAVH